MAKTDVAIIGGGIIGLATAWQLLQARPGTSVVLFEKERELAQHQTGHNSGVLHTGIYYQPGSSRAVNCRSGKLALQQFCQAEGIPFQLCGKVIVAVDESELPQLERLYQRGLANGVRCRLIEQAELKDIEPHAAGIRAVHVPEAGIIDYRHVCERLAESIRKSGGTILTNARVRHVFPRRDSIIVDSRLGEYPSGLVVNCAGLHSDRVARWSGQTPPAKIVPFRGEYYELRPSAHHLCNGLIYPVPDPNFPFLGVHLTRMIHGGVECGPNAVLAFAREGYHKTSVNLLDLLESLTYSGFQRLAWRHWREGLGEFWRSCSKGAFVRALQRLVPELQGDDLVPAPAGVRAQAVDPSGQLVDDFLIIEDERSVHVCNAPSPAATASLQIGKLVVDRLLDRLSQSASAPVLVQPGVL